MRIVFDQQDFEREPSRRWQLRGHELFPKSTPALYRKNGKRFLSIVDRLNLRGLLSPNRAMPERVVAHLELWGSNRQSRAADEEEVTDPGPRLDSVRPQSLTC